MSTVMDYQSHSKFQVASWHKWTEQCCKAFLWSKRIHLLGSSCCAVRRSVFSVCWSRKPRCCLATRGVAQPSTWPQPEATPPGWASCWASPAPSRPPCPPSETTAATHRCTGPATTVSVVWDTVCQSDSDWQSLVLQIYLFLTDV